MVSCDLLSCGIFWLGPIRAIEYSITCFWERVRLTGTLVKKYSFYFLVKNNCCSLFYFFKKLCQKKNIIYFFNCLQLKVKNIPQKKRRKRK